MRGIKTFFLVLLVTGTIIAQEKGGQSDFPIDQSTRLITYTEEVEVDTTKEALYRRAVQFVNFFYKNPTNVFREKDPRQGLVTGYARFRLYIYDKKGNKTQAGLVEYPIEIRCEDRKYSYTISGITWKKPSHYGIEQWFDTKDQSYSKNFVSYLAQVEEYFADLIPVLKLNMRD